MADMSRAGRMIRLLRRRKPALCPRACRRLRFERGLDVLQPLRDPRAIMAGIDGAMGQFGEPLHLFAEFAKAARIGRQPGEGLERAEHACHDSDVARGTSANLVERSGEQTGEGRDNTDHPQFTGIVAARRRELPGDQPGQDRCQMAVEVSLTPGERALSAISTICLMPKAGSWSTVRWLLML